MINVSVKSNTLRYARAEGFLQVDDEIIRLVKEKKVPKGDLLEVSRTAGIQAAKKTSELLVFCHNLPLEWVEISYEFEKNNIRVQAEAAAISRTGVEMEALTAASTALLNMYDMLKPFGTKMTISGVRLMEKRGGKSDFDDHFEHPVKAALLRISDAVADGTRDDNSTGVVEKILNNYQVQVCNKKTIRADKKTMTEEISALADSDQYHFLFTLGATGLTKNDIILETTRELLSYEIPGIAEGMREFGRNRTPFANFSRTTAGVRNNTIIINLPGSSRGASESVHALFPGLKHALRMMNKGKLRVIE